MLYDFFGGTPAKIPLSPYAPRVDAESEKPFMPSSGLDMIRRGDVDSLPYMVGVTSQEGAWMIASLYGENSMEKLKFFNDNLEQAMSSLTGNFFSKEVGTVGIKIPVFRSPM